MATIFWTPSHEVARQLAEGEEGRVYIGIDPAHDPSALKKLEDSLNAYNGSLTLRAPCATSLVEFNRITPNPMAAELAEERALALADMLAVTGIDTIADWTHSIVVNRLKPIDWFHAMDRLSRERALHVQWDNFKLSHRKAKASLNKHDEREPMTDAQALRAQRHKNNRDHLASAFALSAPAESERQEYLAPYRMRG